MRKQRKNSKKSNRKTFDKSNKLAVRYLLSKGFDPVILITHCRHKDMMYTAFRGIVKETDLFNLWDGVAVRKSFIYWIQIKSDAWPSEKKIHAWIKGKKDVKAMAINVRKDGKLSIRDYESL